MKSINPRILALTLAGLLSAASASVLAAQSMPGASSGAAATSSPDAPTIKTYDSNGDGEISIEEFKPQGIKGKSRSGNELVKQDKPGTKRY